MSARPVLLGALLLLAVLTACSGGHSMPAATPASGTDAPVVYPFPPEAVPPEIRVREPKDARGLDYCALLTSAEVRALGLDPATVRPGLTVPHVSGCDWEPVGDPGNLAGFGIRVDTDQPALRGVYIRGERESAMFEPTEVAGHPAVAVRISPTAGCTVEVGIADDQLLSADANSASHPMPDDCERARRIAEAVLAHLPPRTRS